MFVLSLLTYFLFYIFFKEVTEKSERITQLEQEKSALIKQLFEARARSAQDTSTLDSTFIWEKKKRNFTQHQTSARRHHDDVISARR